MFEIMKFDIVNRTCVD